jgi:hypothetical protein
VAAPGAPGRRMGPRPGGEKRRWRRAPGRRAVAAAGRAAGSRAAESPRQQLRPACGRAVAPARRPPGAEKRAAPRQPLRPARRGAPGEGEGRVRRPLAAKRTLLSSRGSSCRPSRCMGPNVYHRETCKRRSPRLGTAVPCPPRSQLAESPWCPPSEISLARKQKVWRVLHCGFWSPRCPPKCVPVLQDLKLLTMAE